MGRGSIEFIEKRDSELVKVFYKYLDGTRTVNDTIHMVLSSPCSRFWCSPENAYKSIISYRKRGVLPSRSLRQQMLRDIMERCNGDYSYLNIERVVYSPAPSFYISFWTAKIAIYQYINKTRLCHRR